MVRVLEQVSEYADSLLDIEDFIELGSIVELVDKERLRAIVLDAVTSHDVDANHVLIFLLCFSDSFLDIYESFL